MKRFARTLAGTLTVIVIGIVLLLAPQKNITGLATVMAASAPPVVCRPVHGTIHSVFTAPPQNCPSPVGQCTVGTITDAGILDGTTTFVATDLALSAGMPSTEPTANLSYSGQLTITASNGTLITHDLGVLDAGHLAFSEIERPFSGTGIFANPGTSVFFISGSIVNNGTGFQGDLTGTVCASGN